jgi:hypothetical protein
LPQIGALFDKSSRQYQGFTSTFSISPQRADIRRHGTGGQTDALKPEPFFRQMARWCDAGGASAVALLSRTTRNGAEMRVDVQFGAQRAIVQSIQTFSDNLSHCLRIQERAQAGSHLSLFLPQVSFFSGINFLLES